MLASLIRTFVPWLVALAGPAAARWLGWTDADLTTAATMLVSGAYYLVARLAEEHLSPRFGWLLGVAKAPVYAPVVRGAHVVTSLEDGDLR